MLVISAQSPVASQQKENTLSPRNSRPFSSPSRRLSIRTPRCKILMREPAARKTPPVIIGPKGAKNAPILLTRTPYTPMARSPPRQLSSRPALWGTQRHRIHRRRRLMPRHSDIAANTTPEGDYVMTAAPRPAESLPSITPPTLRPIDWLVKTIPRNQRKSSETRNFLCTASSVMALVNSAPRPSK